MTCLLPQHTKYASVGEATRTETAKHNWQSKGLAGGHLATELKCQQAHSGEAFQPKGGRSRTSRIRRGRRTQVQGQLSETRLFRLASKNRNRELLLSNDPLAEE